MSLLLLLYMYYDDNALVVYVLVGRKINLQFI